MRAALFLVTGLLLAAVPAAAQYQPPREGGNAAAVRDAANRHYRLGLNYLAGEILVGGRARVLAGDRRWTTGSRSPSTGLDAPTSVSRTSCRRSRR